MNPLSRHLIRQSVSMDIKLTLKQRNELFSSIPDDATKIVKDIQQSLGELSKLQTEPKINKNQLTQEQKENALLLVQHFVDVHTNANPR